MPTEALPVEDGSLNISGVQITSNRSRSRSRCPQEEPRRRVDTPYDLSVTDTSPLPVDTLQSADSAEPSPWSVDTLDSETDRVTDIERRERYDSMAPSADSGSVPVGRTDLLRDVTALFRNAGRRLWPELESRGTELIDALTSLIYTAEEASDRLPEDGPWQELFQFTYLLAGQSRSPDPPLTWSVPEISSVVDQMSRSAYMDSLSLLFVTLHSGDNNDQRPSISHFTTEMTDSAAIAEDERSRSFVGRVRHTGIDSLNYRHEEEDMDGQEELRSAGRTLSRINFTSDDEPPEDDEVSIKETRSENEKSDFGQTTSSGLFRYETPASDKDKEREGGISELQLPESSESPRPISVQQGYPEYPGRIASVPRSLGRYTPTLLAPGNEFMGHQKSDRQVYNVHVEIKHVDMDQSFLCGYLRIEGLTPDHPTLTTYFEGEVIGSKYSFTTRHPDWGSSDRQDMVHWNKFPAWKPLAKAAKSPTFTFKNFSEREHIFMRWKEYFLVPDHRVKSISGASFEGFYYICFNQRQGTFDGIYYHSKSERFQHLTLRHKGRAIGSVPAIELR